MASKGKIALSGANGFIGSKLSAALKKAGYEVCPLVRERTGNPRDIFYDYEEKIVESDKLADCHAVIHLAGKNIFSVWTESAKKEIYDSRVKSTRFLSHTLAKIDGPKILLNASAVGIYGDRADQKLDESSTHGGGFLAKLCVDWERSTLFAKDAGLRVVNMRFGIVLDKEGGMLHQLVPLFKRGLGAILGDGEQYFSYVTRDELVAMILFILENPAINGPVNLVAYEPTTNAEFSQSLAKVYQHKVFFRVPKFVLKTLGEQAASIIYSVRAYPRKLIDHGFDFNTRQSIYEIMQRVVR